MINIEYQEKGLKCDNVECDFRDETIKSIDYEKWVNKHCPKCIDNLLTLQDFYNVRLLESVVRGINEIPQEKTQKKDRVTVEVNLHKTIKFNIKDDKKIKHWFWIQAYYQSVINKSDELTKRFFRSKINRYKKALT